MTTVISLNRMGLSGKAAEINNSVTIPAQSMEVRNVWLKAGPCESDAPSFPYSG
jgi:hypothetical protein